MNHKFEPGKYPDSCGWVMKQGYDDNPDLLCQLPASAAVHDKFHVSMTDYEWRMIYAPRGYRWRRQRVDFSRMAQDAESGIPEGSRIWNVVQLMKEDLQRSCPAYNEADVFTRISIYPKQTGETLNSHDPLVPRFGVQIDMRLPAPEGMKYTDAAPSTLE